MSGTQFYLQLQGGAYDGYANSGPVLLGSIIPGGRPAPD